MRQDFSRQLVQFNGEPMAFRSDANGIPIPATLGDISVEALLSQRVQDGQALPMPGKTHLQAYQLAQRIFEAKEPIDVTAEEVVFIKERVEQHFLQPLVVGQVLLMLEDGGGN